MGHARPSRRKEGTPMIVSVNDKLSLHQCLGQLSIAAHVLTESIGDLNDAANVVMPALFHARN
jgi:hypothetical protein